VLVRPNIHFPSLLFYCNNSTYNHIANVRSVALAKRLYAYHLVNFVDNSGHASVDPLINLILVSSVACNHLLSNVVTWKHQFILLYVSLGLDCVEVGFVAEVGHFGMLLHYKL
jgi:hypothetical protein